MFQPSYPPKVVTTVTRPTRKTQLDLRLTSVQSLISTRQATRGYAAGRGQGRKPTPEPFYHSARPGEGANVQTSRPTAEPQPSHTAETGIASSNTSATGASSSTTSSSVPPSVPPTSGTSPVRSSGATGSDSSQGVGTSQNPAGTPLPPKRNSSGTPVALATLVGAGVGAYAYYTSEENALLPPKAVAPDTTTAAVAEKTTQADTDSKKDKPLASDTALKPVALSAARRLFGKEKEEAEKKESLVSVSAQTLSAPAPAPKKEKTPTPPPVKPVKVDISKQAEEVFHNAADALLAATGAAADAARRADEKETAARRMSSQTSEKSSGDSSLAGPALAARAAALESVAQKFSKDSKHGKEIRARSRAAEKEMASLTPTALVAASFQGAAEVRVLFFFFFSRLVFFCLFRWSLYFPHYAATLSCPAIPCRVSLFTQPEPRLAAGLLLRV